MKTKTFLISSLVGGITFFILGFLFYGMAFVNFFEQNAGSATGVMKNPPSFVSLFLGELSFGALYAYIFLQWASISTFKTGAKGGAVIGLLMGLGYYLISYATSNLFNFSGALANVAISVVSGAIGGGVIGWISGKVE